MESQKGRDAVVQHALLPSHSPLEKTPHNFRIMDNAAKIVSGVIKFIAPRISSAPYFEGYHIPSFQSFWFFSSITSVSALFNGHPPRDYSSSRNE
jgi:hypothetical protein